MKPSCHVLRTSAAVFTAVVTMAVWSFIAAFSAKADISCPAGPVPPSVSQDCYFLSMMKTRNIPGSQTDLISAAHTACNEMAADTGANPLIDEMLRVQRANPQLTQEQAAFFAGIAAAAYCPGGQSSGGPAVPTAAASSTLTPAENQYIANLTQPQMAHPNLSVPDLLKLGHRVCSDVSAGSSQAQEGDNINSILFNQGIDASRADTGTLVHYALQDLCPGTH